MGVGTDHLQVDWMGHQDVCRRIKYRSRLFSSGLEIWERTYGSASASLRLNVSTEKRDPIFGVKEGGGDEGRRGRDWLGCGRICRHLTKTALKFCRFRHHGSSKLRSLVLEHYTFFRKGRDLTNDENCNNQDS